MAWKPPPRPDWLDSLNSLGHGRGGPAALVSLGQDSLLKSARQATGLDDFGGDGFHEGLSVLLGSLEDEAALNLFGRLRARAELQRVLESRLRVHDLFKRHPEIRDQQIREPVFVTGLARTGTTIVHELLWKDPAHRAPLLWEMMYPVPPPERVSYATDPRIAVAHKEIGVMELAVPEFGTMHENAGDLPSECIFIFAHELRTEMFIGNYKVPGYAMWMAGQDLTGLYEYHRDFLKLLQWKNPGGRWVLKAPSHLNHLPALLSAYPDARIVVTHRDPLKVLGSLCNLMATLQWMHSDEVDYDAVVATMSMGYGYLVERSMRLRDDGSVPQDRVIDLVHADLVADPLAAIEGVYQGWGTELSEQAGAAIRGHLAGKRPAGGHDYSFAETGLDLASERERYAGYQRRFSVPAEVDD